MVQLVLCLVILVGQRVLGGAADRRAVLTFEHAEAIFEQVADLQGHLDRHDRVLGRGVSLLESSPHPWTVRHRVQSPPCHQPGGDVNGRIAAWLTKRLGTDVGLLCGGRDPAGLDRTWPRRAFSDSNPYPFIFMSFLSTLSQLIFMIVIMVSRGVLRKSRPTAAPSRPS